MTNAEQWTESSFTQPLQRMFAEKDEILKDAFLSHFGFAIEEVEDKENLEHIIVNGEPISSFRYRGETFLYMQDKPDYEIDNDKITFTTLYRKV